jgi:hypothetical protein
MESHAALSSTPTTGETMTSARSLRNRILTILERADEFQDVQLYEEELLGPAILLVLQNGDSYVLTVQATQESPHT